MKIRIYKMPAAGDKHHIRHFYEALMACDPANIKLEDGEDRDFTFTNIGSFKPTSGLTVIYFAHDPHSLVTDIDMRYALSEKLVKLGKMFGMPENFHDMEREKFAGRGYNVSISIYLDQFDIYATFLKDTLADRLVPVIKHTAALLIPNNAPERIFNTTLREERKYDVFFTGAQGANYYPLRALAYRELHKPGLGISVNWPACRTPSVAEMNKTWTVEQFDQHQCWYASCLRDAKACVFDGSIYDYPLARHVECMATGCLVLSPMPRESSFLGYEDGVNMVAIDPDDWLDKLRYYLAHDKERLEIITNARDLVTKYHTCGARARIVLAQLQRIKNGESVQSVAWSA